MATVTPNPLVESMSGKAGNKVYYKRWDKLFMRQRVKGTNPNTEEQRSNRQSFTEAVKSWQALAEEEKSKYNKKARYLNMSGYNLYISGFMKERISAGYKYNSDNNISIYRKAPSAGMLRFPSVLASLHVRITFGNAVKPFQFSYS
jgi:hypothetical protein